MQGANQMFRSDPRGFLEMNTIVCYQGETPQKTDINRIQGNTLAGAAITTTGGTLNGNAWAGAAGVGDVTFTGTAVVGCGNGNGNGDGDDDHGKGHKDKGKCNQGVGNGPEGCDPGNSNHKHGSNDEHGGHPGEPGRKGGH